ncbi:MAG: DPP IV N-terminal domain-containing protein [Maricaulaceae bacterium]
MTYKVFTSSLTKTICLSVSFLALSACQNNVTDKPDSTESKNSSFLTNNPESGKLTPERLNAAPSLSGASLRRPTISPDGSMVTFLQGPANNPGQQDLWAYDIESGKASLLVSSTDLISGPEVLSEEEKNRRERAREYGGGIISYQFISERLLMFPLGGDIYLYDLDKKKSRQVTATLGFESDPKLSSSGRYVAYVRDNELYVTDLKTGLERQLTDSATQTRRNATASFVVQEELARSSGYWWSPNETQIAYSQIDESPIAIESRLDFGADGISTIHQRYPFAGTDNARVKLGLISRQGGPTVWADLGRNEDIYLTRVTWARDGKTVYAGILSRDHKSHKILQIDPKSGTSKLLNEETSPTWLNIRSDYTALKNGDLLYTAERNDKRQVFRLSPDGRETAISPDNLLVNSLSCFNEDTGDLYLTGWKDTPLDRHIFTMKMDGSGLTQLTEGSGQHSARFDGNCTRYIGGFNRFDTPPQSRVFDNKGQPLLWLSENALSNDSDHPYSEYLDAHITPEFGQIPADDGTMMDYYLYKPKDLAPGEKRPTITIVYGGPGVQRVNHGWGRTLFSQMLAAHGFIVFSLDNRGATNRGKAFEDVLYRSMGHAEVVDQSAGAEWLKSQPFVDPDKMGIYGWSYGGYMTLHMLAQTNHYSAGVSGAPVTDWALYDTAYTERYLGDPRPDHPNYTQGSYENNSVFAHINGLTEDTLLIHGMADDNVVFRHSVKLMDAMQKAGRHNMRIMTYPGEKHGFRAAENRTHRDRQILEFFLEKFGTDK